MGDEDQVEEAAPMTEAVQLPEAGGGLGQGKQGQGEGCARGGEGVSQLLPLSQLCKRQEATNTQRTVLI